MNNFVKLINLKIKIAFIIIICASKSLGGIISDATEQLNDGNN